MQYWQRRLQRSVTEIRRLRSGRPNRSRTGETMEFGPSIKAQDGAFLLFSPPPEAFRMRRARWIHTLSLAALLAAAPLAQNRPEQADPPDTPRVAGFKARVGE